MKRKNLAIIMCVSLGLGILGGCGLIQNPTTGSNVPTTTPNTSITESSNPATTPNTPEKYMVNEEEWKTTLDLKNLKNGTVDVILSQSNPQGGQENKIITTFDIIENGFKLNFIQNEIQMNENYYDFSESNILKVYEKYIIDSSNVVCRYQSLSLPLDKETEMRDIMHSFIVGLTPIYYKIALLTECYSIATFDDGYYMIDGKDLPYYMHGRDGEFDINNSIVKYRFENKQLVFVEAQEKDNGKKLTINISNIGNTIIDFQATNLCIHEGKSTLNSELSALLANNSGHIEHCDDCGDISVAHTYVDGVCSICEYEYKIEDLSLTHDIEYLNFVGYPKDGIVIYKNKETQKIEYVKFKNGDFGTSLGTSYEGYVIVCFGYNVYIERKKVVEGDVSKEKYSFYYYDTKELLQEIVIE